MGYAKELLQEIARLKLWALGAQFTLNCLDDPEFVDLLSAANCRMAFLGMESLHEPSLKAVRKRHNKVAEYRDKYRMLRERGILTFSGVMLALDEDTPEYYAELPERLEGVDPSAIFLSIAIPIPGTPFHHQLESEGRIFDHDLSHYEGDHVVFRARTVTPAQVIETRKRLMRSFYSWPSIARRWWRLVRDSMAAGRGRHRWLGIPLITFVLFQLSRFQRYHARRRVYPAAAPRLTPTARAPADAAGHPSADPAPGPGPAGASRRASPIGLRW
jgi:radical SAM superfamily enzyme YgiQ (UPF0313 family)